MSASRNTGPSTWKFARVSACSRKIMKPISKFIAQFLYFVSLVNLWKLMQVVSTIKNHVEHHNLRNKRQWAYKKGHSTQLLLAKMTEDWRSALDRKLVVGVVFIDFRKASDSLPHNILLYKLQSVGIASDLWCWIRDYLTDRHQATVVNGCKSESIPVRFGVPQGSVLRPLLFSIFCNDLPDVVADENEDIEMYADDTTLYVVARTHDEIAIMLNNTLKKLIYEWCCLNGLSPRPGTSPKLGNNSIKQVLVSRCLGLEIDYQLNWNYHVSEVIKAFTQKLNLLKSLCVLPKKGRENFYFKVILPSVTYGMMIWSSCGKTLMDEIERIHVRAAKIIYKLDWGTPSDQVLVKANWNTIRDMNSKCVLCFAYKCYYGHVPEQLQSIVRKSNHTYDFRRKLSLALPVPKSNYVRNSIS